MKQSLMDILCCPACQKELELSVSERSGEEILGGTLHCRSCPRDFDIQDGIPNLLIEDSRVPGSGSQRKEDA